MKNDKPIAHLYILLSPFLGMPITALTMWMSVHWWLDGDHRSALQRLSSAGAI